MNMPHQLYTPKAVARTDRYLVKVEQYAHYHRNGYLKIDGLLSNEDVNKLSDWSDDLFYGRIELEGLDPLPDNPSNEQLYDRIQKNRIHNLHKKQEIAEWGLLLPRVLDVTEALIGPDILAVQSMVFFNPPGRGGQGWHQDSYYIKSYPDLLVGAWIALEDADEENGCLWVVPGSNCEPIYPGADWNQRAMRGHVHAKDAFENMIEVTGVSNLDDETNTLAQVVRKYPDPIPVPMKKGDVLFFHSHMFHRSYPNRTEDRLRRSYVCHYVNARSWLGWNGGNENHILARGRTHLPYGLPVFGTPVDINTEDAPDDSSGEVMMGMEDGMMVKVTPAVDNGY
jgi:chlorinating enzyme